MTGGMIRGIAAPASPAPLILLPRTKRGLIYISPGEIKKGEILETQHGKAQVMSVERWEVLKDVFERDMGKEEFESLRGRIRHFLGDESRYYEVWIRYLEPPRDYDTLDWSEYGNLSKVSSPPRKKLGITYKVRYESIAGTTGERVVAIPDYVLDSGNLRYYLGEWVKKNVGPYAKPIEWWKE